MNFNSGIYSSCNTTIFRMSKELLQAVAEANLECVKDNDIGLVALGNAHIILFDVVIVSSKRNYEEDRRNLIDILHDRNSYERYNVKSQQPIFIYDKWHQLFTVRCTNVQREQLLMYIDQIRNKPNVHITKITYGKNYKGLVKQEKAKRILQNTYNVSLREKCLKIKRNESTLRILQDVDVTKVKLSVYDTTLQTIDDLITQHIKLIPKEFT